MPSDVIVKSVEIASTPRNLQLRGMFDLSEEKTSQEKWNIDFSFPDTWNIGIIVGPSGAGKTTIAKHLFPDFIEQNYHWSDDKSIVDDFPGDMSIKEITKLLSMIGFSSPPSWLRPFRVLSNGEQFRCSIARAIAESNDIIVIDEFTSVVDRTVAKIGSSAIQKLIRKSNKKFVAVSCHYDILDWLEPDWVYQPHIGEFYSGRYLHQRPGIELKIKRVHHSAWRVFRKHHYLDTSLNTAAKCYCAFVNDSPVAFASFLHFPHPIAKNIKREHRTVCLPDYQGVGIGNALSDFIGSMVIAMGYRYQSQTSHPAMINARNNSQNWVMIAKPNRTTKSMVKGWDLSKQKGASGITRRYRATFEYVGARMENDLAQILWS